MLLNLSNHPSTTWSETQLLAAHKLYGEVVDMPFPKVPPEADAQGVRQLAADTLTRIQAILPGEPSSHCIMLNGEQSFIILFYDLAKGANFRCCVATSERNTHLNPDGSKTIVFEFVRFREL